MALSGGTRLGPDYWILAWGVPDKNGCSTGKVIVLKSQDNPALTLGKGLACLGPSFLLCWGDTICTVAFLTSQDGCGNPNDT